MCNRNWSKEYIKINNTWHFPQMVTAFKEQIETNIEDSARNKT